ncbi:MAG: holo-ACP synthase [bacterium]
MIRGIGVDVVEVDRIARILGGNGHERFLARVYTSAELQYCVGKARRTEHLAARFAAKEAVFKALGTGWSGGIGWKDVEVRNEATGLPRVFLHGKALEVFRERGGGKLLLSISHTSRVAVAHAVWESEEPPGPPGAAG